VRICGTSGQHASTVQSQCCLHTATPATDSAVFRVSSKNHFPFIAVIFHVTNMEEISNEYKNLKEKYEWHKPLGKPRCRWKKAINSSEQTKYEDVNWINLAQVRK